MKQIYDYGYFPLFAIILVPRRRRLAAPRRVPPPRERARSAATFTAQSGPSPPRKPSLLALWKTLPHSQPATLAKLLVFVATLLFMGRLAYHGRLYRTRPIIPGELMVSD